MPIKKASPKESVDVINRRLQAEIEMLQDNVARLQKGTVKETQPYHSYFQPGVDPLALSGLRLSGGQKEPFYYSLGADSTVPFVSLTGGGANQKVFSWGELIKVEPGQTVTVKSESYMKGDIQINSGKDYCTKPGRISNVVEVEDRILEIDPLPPFTFKVAKFPCDTRLAKRAYVKIKLQTNSQIVSCLILGSNKKHSFPGAETLPVPILQLFGNVPASYSALQTIPSFTVADTIPLGYGVDGTDLFLPMALTDTAYFAIGSFADPPDYDLGTLFMYVVEY